MYRNFGFLFRLSTKLFYNTIVTIFMRTSRRCKMYFVFPKTKLDQIYSVFGRLKRPSNITNTTVADINFPRGSFRLLYTTHQFRTIIIIMVIRCKTWGHYPHYDGPQYNIIETLTKKILYYYFIPLWFFVPNNYLWFIYTRYYLIAC